MQQVGWLAQAGGSGQSDTWVCIPLLDVLLTMTPSTLPLQASAQAKASAEVAGGDEAMQALMIQVIAMSQETQVKFTKLQTPHADLSPSRRAAAQCQCQCRHKAPLQHLRKFCLKQLLQNTAATSGAGHKRGTENGQGWTVRRGFDADV